MEDAVAALDALQEDLGTVAAGYGEDAVVTTAAGCWALRLPAAGGDASLGLIRLTDTGAEEALAFAQRARDNADARLCLALDATANPDAACEVFRAAGWRVSGAHSLYELPAGGVPAWDDALVLKQLGTPRDARRTHAIVTAAAGCARLTAEQLDDALRFTRTHPQHTMYGAMVGEAMVATVRTVRRAQHCGVYLLATDPAHQRKGYAGALLDQVLYLERERGAAVFRALGIPGVASVLEGAGFTAIAPVAYATPAAP